MVPQSPEAEGGCGVTGFACTIPVGGKHIYEPSIQMRNRGNGKGGGIAACGLVPEDLGVSRKVLDEDYILQVALLDPAARGEVEKKYIEPCFDVDQGGLVPTVDDYRDVPLLEIRPPDVARYFVRVKPDVLERFADEKGLDRPVASGRWKTSSSSRTRIALNDEFYASLGDKRAFVLSHARNLIILKIVGYAEAAVQYYRMADTRAHVWIAHQRYPTQGPRLASGRGAPVHRHERGPGPQRRLRQLPLGLRVPGPAQHLPAVPDRHRGLGPAVRPVTASTDIRWSTSSRPWRRRRSSISTGCRPEKQRIYRQIQAAHMHGSPDGPWFFIIARSLAEAKSLPAARHHRHGHAAARRSSPCRRARSRSA